MQCKSNNILLYFILTVKTHNIPPANHKSDHKNLAEMHLRRFLRSRWEFKSLAKPQEVLALFNTEKLL